MNDIEFRLSIVEERLSEVEFGSLRHMKLVEMKAALLALLPVAQEVE